MANRIFIEFYNPLAKNGTGEKQIIDSPLNDDVLVDIQSEFQSLSDIIPSNISGLLSTFKTIQSVDRRVSADLEKLLNFPLWTGTKPLKLNFPITFYLKDNAKVDVWEKTWGLASTSMINVRNGKWRAPGISIKDAKNIKKASDDQTVKTTLTSVDATSTVISIEIPNICYLPIAVVYNAKPTFSKTPTKSEIDGKFYPVWGRVDLEIRSIYPANTEMIKSFNSSYGSISERETGAGL